jgi:hypothetical protein
MSRFGRRDQDGNLVPEIADWIGGIHEVNRLQAQGITVDRTKVDLGALGKSIADAEPPMTQAELDAYVEQIKEQNQVRRRVLDGGPVHQDELDADRVYYRLYGLPTGCIVDWRDGRRTIVTKDPDGTRHHQEINARLQNSVHHTTPEAGGGSTPEFFGDESGEATGARQIPPHAREQRGFSKASTRRRRPTIEDFLRRDPDDDEWTPG